MLGQLDCSNSEGNAGNQNQTLRDHANDAGDRANYGIFPIRARLQLAINNYQYQWGESPADPEHYLVYGIPDFRVDPRELANLTH